MNELEKVYELVHCKKKQLTKEEDELINAECDKHKFCEECPFFDSNRRKSDGVPCIYQGIRYEEAETK